MNQVPPYQAIDIVLGKNHPDLPEPISGFVICCPSNGTTMFESMEEAEEAQPKIMNNSKWPNCCYIRKAWIHQGEVINGMISNRKYWSVR